MGSNLGDRVELMTRAADECRLLNAKGEELLKSGLYVTEPVGCPEGAERYLNAVVELGWDGTPEALLAACQAIEARLGRVRTGIINEPRTLDVDVLYLDGLQLDGPSLILPHPGMKERKFVLKPLCDIRPGLILPGEERTVKQILESLDTVEQNPVLLRAVW